MDNRYEQDYRTVLHDVTQALMDKIPIMIAIALIFAVIGWSVSAFLITPQYEASVNMIVNTRDITSGNITNDNISSAQNLVDTYAVIIKSNTILNKVISDLNLDMDYEDLYEMLSVDDINNTQIMKISVKSSSPDTSRSIVQAIAQIAPPIVVDAVEAGSCKVVSDIYSSNTPVSPNVMKNTVISCGAGVVAYLAILVLKVLMVDFIVDDTDMDRKLGIPVLAVIPNVED